LGATIPTKQGGYTGDKLGSGLGLLSYLGSKSNDFMPASLAALVTFLSNEEELPLLSKDIDSSLVIKYHA